MRHRVPIAVLGASLLALAAGLAAHAEQTPASGRVTLVPSTLKAVAKVDERFQSFNVEMAEVVGGRFWAPYPRRGEGAPVATPQQGGVYASTAFRKRPPVELAANRRLRTLARALGPSYMRVSGTWAN